MDHISSSANLAGRERNVVTEFRLFYLEVIAILKFGENKYSCFCYRFVNNIYRYLCTDVI